MKELTPVAQPQIHPVLIKLEMARIRLEELIAKGEIEEDQRDPILGRIAARLTRLELATAAGNRFVIKPDDEWFIVGLLLAKAKRHPLGLFLDEEAKERLHALPPGPKVEAFWSLMCGISCMRQRQGLE